MSANDARSKLKVVKGRRLGTLSNEIDLPKIERLIVKAQAEPSYEARASAAIDLVAHMARVMGLVRIMAAEIEKLRPVAQMFARQNADLATIASVLLEGYGGEHRVRSDWFATYERRGIEVLEGDGEVVFRLLEGVPLESASQQTKERSELAH